MINEESSIIIKLKTIGERMIEMVWKTGKPEKFKFTASRIPLNARFGRRTKQDAINHLNNSFKKRTEMSPPIIPTSKLKNFLNAVSFLQLRNYGKY